MKTVQRIIDLFGGLRVLRNNPINLEVEGFMPLSIEFIGYGPRELPMVSIMHHFEQNGDLMRDPQIEYEIDGQGKWHPISYRQDSIGLMREAVFVDDKTGRVMARPKLVRDLQRFSATWSKNLDEQGFVDAARKAVAGKRGGKPKSPVDGAVAVVRIVCHKVRSAVLDTAYPRQSPLAVLGRERLPLDGSIPNKSPGERAPTKHKRGYARSTVAGRRWSFSLVPWISRVQAIRLRQAGGNSGLSVTRETVHVHL